MTVNVEIGEEAEHVVVVVVVVALAAATEVAEVEDSVVAPQERAALETTILRTDNPENVFANQDGI